MTFASRTINAAKQRMRSVALQLTVAQLATASGAFIVNILMARALGPSGRGEIALYLQLSYLIGAFLSLGRDRAFNVIYKQVRSTRYGVNELLRLFRAPVILSIVTAFVLAGTIAPSGARALIFIGFLALLVGNLSSRALRALAIGTLKATPFAITTTVSQVCLVACGSLLLFYGHTNPKHWVLLYGLSQFVPLFCLLQWTSYKERGNSVGDASLRKSTKSLGYSLIPATTFELALSKVDKLLLPVLGSYTQLGYYTVVATLIEMAGLPIRQYVDSSVPKWAQRHQTGSFRIWRSILPSIFLASLLTAAASAAAYFLIEPLFGTEYSAGRQLIPMLGIATFMHSMVIILTALCLALKSGRGASIIGISGFLVSTPLLFTLIPNYGANGAAVSIASGFTAATLVGALVVYRLVSRSPKKRAANR